MIDVEPVVSIQDHNDVLGIERDLSEGVDQVGQGITALNSDGCRFARLVARLGSPRHGFHHRKDRRSPRPASSRTSGQETIQASTDVRGTATAVDDDEESCHA